MAPKAKSKVKPIASIVSQFQAKSTSPNWPPLKPQVPACDLSFTTLLNDQIFVIPNFFTSSLCKSYVSFFSTLPLTTTPGKPKRGEATRVNDRYQIEDPTFADRLWRETALQRLISSHDRPSIWGGEVLGLNSNLRIYRYKSGMFFDQHYDESNKLDFGAEKVHAKTTWTLLIYLTTCEGGETVFYPEQSGRKDDKTPPPVVVGMETGQALLHKHGDDCLLHEGREVTKGEKWVLRSDIVVRR